MLLALMLNDANGSEGALLHRARLVLSFLAY